MTEIHEETYLMVASLLLVGWVLWLLFRRFQLNGQARLHRMEAFTKLIDKFGSAKEFTEFIETDSGKKLFSDQQLPASNPSRVALRFIQVGIIFGALAVAFFIDHLHVSHALSGVSSPDPNDLRKIQEDLFWSTLWFSLSIGMFVLAGVTQFLGRKWNLLNGNTGNPKADH